MASSAIHGLKGKVYIDTTAATIPDDLLAEVGNVSLRFRSGVVDVTNRTTSEINGVIWSEVIYGANDWSGTMDINHVPANVDLGVIHDALIGQTALYILVVSQVGAGLPQWSGRIIVEEIGLDMPTASQALERVSFRSGGVLTRGTQAT